MPPVEVSALLIAGLLYAFAVRRVGGVTPGRQVCFYAGLAVILAAICSPLGGVAQQGLLTAHMLQHTLIGAVAPLLLLLGMPRPFATAVLSERTQRRIERIENPLITFPLWTLTTIVWLLAPVHSAVLENASRADRLVRRKRARLTADRVGYMAHPDWVARPALHVPGEVWRPRINTRDGLKATARWYREKGWL